MSVRALTFKMKWNPLIFNIINILKNGSSQFSITFTFIKGFCIESIKAKLIQSLTLFCFHFSFDWFDIIKSCGFYFNCGFCINRKTERRSGQMDIPLSITDMARVWIYKSYFFDWLKVKIFQPKACTNLNYLNPVIKYIHFLIEIV